MTQENIPSFALAKEEAEAKLEAYKILRYQECADAQGRGEDISRSCVQSIKEHQADRFIHYTICAVGCFFVLTLALAILARSFKQQKKKND